MIEARPVAAPRFAGRAFGIELVSDFAVPGVLQPAGTHVPRLTHSRHLRLTLADTEAVKRVWPQGAERTFELGDLRGRPIMTIERDHHAGYRVWIRGLGRCIISSQGDHILYAPRGSSHPWRLLTGQGLPIAAALQGLEVLHASAVTFGGHSFAFVASSGTGKTSIAVRLLLHGAKFLADDVVALESVEGALMAHPGVAVAHVPVAEQVVLRDLAFRRRGNADEREKQDVTLPLPTGPSPLHALYFLERAEAVEDVEIIAVTCPDVRLLMSATFVSHVPTAARLVTQLDICSRIARTVPVYRVRSPLRGGAAQLAERIARHAELI